MSIHFPRVRVLPDTSGEHLIWEGKPSLRIVIPSFLALVLALIFTIVFLNGYTWAGILALILLVIGFIALQQFGVNWNNIQTTFSIRYQLTNHRLIVSQGIFTRTINEVDLIYFRATSVSQNYWLKWLKLGTVSLHREVENPPMIPSSSRGLSRMLSAPHPFSSDTPLYPAINLELIPNPINVKELARVAIIKRKDEQGLRYTDIL